MVLIRFITKWPGVSMSNIDPSPRIVAVSVQTPDKGGGPPADLFYIDHVDSDLSIWISDKWHEYLGDGFKYMFYFHPEPWGKDPIWRLRIFWLPIVSLTKKRCINITSLHHFSQATFLTVGWRLGPLLLSICFENIVTINSIDIEIDL